MQDHTFQNLIQLLQLFNGMPELLAQKLLQFNCLNPDFLTRLNNNQALKESMMKNDLVNSKPYFRSLVEIHAFYDKFFIETKIEEVKQLPPSKDPSDVLQRQLEKAVALENFELATSIKKYMLMVGISPKRF